MALGCDRRRDLAAAGALALALLAPGCASPSPARAEIRVSAAASLTEAFGELETAFETAHPELDLRLNLGGSSALREQILGGAPVDVFASANARNMARVAEAGQVVGAPRVFAHNRMRIAVPAGNPAGVTSLADFARPELLLGLCGPQVPCGELAREALARAGVEPALDTEEPDVRALLTKIEAGELDAGITYATDLAAAAGRARGIAIPEAWSPRADYHIAVLAGAPDPRGAAAFVRFVLSPEGAAILRAWGFETP